jgi:hypothetical protein
MRGKKGEEHFDPSDPPRRRANKQRGHGTYENDRPPIVGTVGRESGQVRLRVVHHTDGETLEKHVHQFTLIDRMCYTDEWLGYNHLIRPHATVCHAQHEWARDDDGDGIREVHVIEEGGQMPAILAPFQRVHKRFLRVCRHGRVSPHQAHFTCLHRHAGDAFNHEP